MRSDSSILIIFFCVISKRVNELEEDWIIKNTQHIEKSIKKEEKKTGKPVKDGITSKDKKGGTKSEYPIAKI